MIEDKRPLTRSSSDLSYIPRERHPREGGDPGKCTLAPGSQILRKSKLTLRFPKFWDDAIWLVGEVTRRAGEGPFPANRGLFYQCINHFISIKKTT